MSPAPANTPPAPRPHVAVHDNPGRHRFEAEIDGTLSYAEYVLGDGTMTFTHTLVPESLRGRGIGTQLVHAGLAAAQAQRRGVIPQCSMFADYMRHRPETHTLLAPAGRALLHV
jgi:predicted GNAT family acetyltransferase